MKIKVLGVCGSPIKGGNTEVFLEEARRAGMTAPVNQTLTALVETLQNQYGKSDEEER